MLLKGTCDFCSGNTLPVYVDVGYILIIYTFQLAHAIAYVSKTANMKRTAKKSAIVEMTATKSTLYLSSDVSYVPDRTTETNKHGWIFAIKRINVIVFYIYIYKI